MDASQFPPKGVYERAWLLHAKQLLDGQVKIWCTRVAYERPGDENPQCVDLDLGAFSGLRSENGIHGELALILGFIQDQLGVPVSQRRRYEN